MADEVQAATIKCPFCAEQIQATAKKCRFCGEFLDPAAQAIERPTPQSTEQETAAKAEKKNKTIRGVVALLLIVFTTYTCASLRNTGSTASSNNAASSSGAATKSDTAPVSRISVTSQELFEAYNDNEAAAQQKYGASPLAVSGTIESIDLDFANNTVLKLETGDRFFMTQAKLSDSSKTLAASLKKGQGIIVNCSSVTRIIKSPMLEGCDIATQ